MKKKVLIGIIALCLVVAIVILVFGKTSNVTYELRSYTTSQTFFITGPKGYKHDENRTGILNSKVVFNKENKINTTLTYSFESKEIDRYLDSMKKATYESNLDSDYYENLTWQDTKTLTVNDIEIKYVKVSYNNGSTYYSDIYSIATVHGWKICCEIQRYGDSDNFESDSKILEDAWGITFTEEEF